MTQLALDTFEIAALAFQYHDLDPSQQTTIAEREAVARTEKLIQLYLMRTAIDQRYTNQHTDRCPDICHQMARIRL